MAPESNGTAIPQPKTKGKKKEGYTCSASHASTSGRTGNCDFRESAVSQRKSKFRRNFVEISSKLTTAPEFDPPTIPRSRYRPGGSLNSGRYQEFQKMSKKLSFFSQCRVRVRLRASGLGTTGRVPRRADVTPVVFSPVDRPSALDFASSVASDVGTSLASDRLSRSTTTVRSASCFHLG